MPRSRRLGSRSVSVCALLFDVRLRSSRRTGLMPKELPIGSDASASSSSHGARATADLEDALAWPQVGEVNGPPSHDWGAAERKQRDHEVITRRPTDQVSVGRRVCLGCVAVTVSGGHAVGRESNGTCCGTAAWLGPSVIHILARHHVRWLVRFGHGLRWRRAPGLTPRTRQVRICPIPRNCASMFSLARS